MLDALRTAAAVLMWVCGVSANENGAAATFSPLGGVAVAIRFRVFNKSLHKQVQYTI